MIIFLIFLFPRNFPRISLIFNFKSFFFKSNNIFFKKFTPKKICDRKAMRKKSKPSCEFYFFLYSIILLLFKFSITSFVIERNFIASIILFFRSYFISPII